jgi:hypothetical protein
VALRRSSTTEDEDQPRFLPQDGRHGRGRRGNARRGGRKPRGRPHR